MDIVIEIINLIIEALSACLNFIFCLLPSSPFKAIDNSPIAEFLSNLNFFIPVAEIIAIGQAWLLVIGSYYIYQMVLRWMKAIN
ncbi:hypothetical protein KPL40_19680 [Clostridium gasigenes]|uniref:hypothetical protein n=1 Tax=Clostridium gasigenes TaxID=94869 RepID=UPI001C0B4262|nr:hypothetical protein [Clostridium gasigenes]MBU3134625.1 hypothetical protein [Clostridium gasigenes]